MLDVVNFHFEAGYAGMQKDRGQHHTFFQLLMAFFMVHIVMVVLAGPINELRSMITGWYRTSPGTETEEKSK